MTEPNIVRGCLFAFIGVAAFSLTLPMTTLAVDEYGTLKVAVWRAIFAAIVASCIILWDLQRSIRLRQGFIRPIGKQWLLLLLCTFGVVFGFPVFTTLAMSQVSASHGAVVIGLLPLSTAVFGFLLSDEKPTKGFWVVAIIGTLLTVTFALKQSSVLGTILSWGHVYLFAAVIAAGFGYAAGGQLAKTMTGWRVACWNLILAIPVLGVLAFYVDPVPVNVLSTPFNALVYLALVSQLLGFFAWFKGLAEAGIVRASQIQLLQLFLTVAVAIVFLGEPFDVDVIIFGAAVVVCVAIGAKIRFN